MNKLETNMAARCLSKAGGLEVLVKSVDKWVCLCYSVVSSNQVSLI